MNIYFGLDKFIWFSVFKFDAEGNDELANYSGCRKLIEISFLWFTCTIEQSQPYNGISNWLRTGNR